MPAADQPTQLKQASTNPTQQEAATSTPMKQVVTPTKQPDTEAEASNSWLSSRRFDVGVKVKVDGLTSPDGRALNGEIGVIVEMREGSDRVGVRFHDSRDIKGIKPSSLSQDFSETFPGTVGL